MAQYDGSIRIATKITTKDAEESLASLEWQIKKSAKYMDELRSKMDALKDEKIPTKDYKDLQEKLSTAEKELKGLVAEQERYNEIGITSGGAWDALNEKVASASDKVDLIKEKMQELSDVGKDFTLGKDTEQYAAMARQLQYEEESIRKAAEHYNKLLGKTKQNYADLSKKAKEAFGTVGNVLKKSNSSINAFGRKIREVAQRHLSFFRKETDKTKKSISGFAGRLKSLALSLLIFNQISAAFRTVTSSIKDGFQNMYNDNLKFKSSIDSLKASVLTLKNAFAAAFRPIVDIAVPYIQKLVEWLTHAVNLAGQFFAALTGRKTYTRAIKQTAKASEEAAEAAKEETEEINKQLSPLDKLNNLTSENNKEKDKGKDKDGVGTGIMFEEVPIDSNIQKMADKVKDILSKLFEPIKKAWKKEGKFVMESWKYALKEIWKLVKDIGRDFLKVWRQDATVKIFENIFHIIGDIGLVVGHLARNFRDAWNENETGLRILENIRDIIGVIVENIRLAADKTVEWADKLNFNPLLEAFERFTKSIIPLADALSGVLSDFYTKVLLPLGKWTIEKGLPELLDVFTAFNEKVDWDALRERLSEFWDHLEPFAETVGEGLIIFIERVSDALADFINSEAFNNFLTRVEEWMDSVTPEDVADALVGIAEALIALKLALLGFSAVSAVVGVFTTIKTFLGFIAGFGGIISQSAGLVASGVGGIVTALGGILPALSLVAAAVIGWKIGEWINENLLGVDTPSFFEIMDGIKSSFTDGSWKEALRLWGEDIKSAFVEVWESAERGWNGMWDSVKRGWNQTAEWIKSAVERIKRIVESLKGSFNFWTGSAGGKLFGNGRTSSAGGTSRMASSYAAHQAIEKLNNMPIPGYATGQVIPRTMQKHLAWLGDNPRETEVVSPLSTIEQAVINAMAKVNGSANNSGGNTYQFSVDGRVFFEIMQKYAEEYKKQSGGRPAFS